MGDDSSPARIVKASSYVTVLAVAISTVLCCNSAPGEVMTDNNGVRSTVAPLPSWELRPSTGEPRGSVGRLLPLRIDFGPGRHAPGSTRFGAARRDPGYGWVEGLIRDVNRAQSDDPWFSDFTTGEDAIFELAVFPPDSVYRLGVSLGDPEEARGPVAILVNGAELTKGGVATGPGERTDISGDVRAVDGKLAIQFVSGCDGFAVSGISVFGPGGARLARLFPDDRVEDSVPPSEALQVPTDGQDRAGFAGVGIAAVIQPDVFKPESGGMNPDAENHTSRSSKPAHERKGNDEHARKN